MTQLDVGVNPANRRRGFRLTYEKTCFCVSSGRSTKRTFETAIVVSGSHLEDGDSGLDQSIVIRKSDSFGWV